MNVDEARATLRKAVEMTGRPPAVDAVEIADYSDKMSRARSAVLAPLFDDGGERAWRDDTVCTSLAAELQELDCVWSAAMEHARHELRERMRAWRQSRRRRAAY